MIDRIWCPYFFCHVWKNAAGDRFCELALAFFESKATALRLPPSGVLRCMGRSAERRTAPCEFQTPCSPCPGLRVSRAGVEANTAVKDTGKAERKPVAQKRAMTGKEKKTSIHERLEINKKIIQGKQGQDKMERGADLGVRTV